MCYNVNSMYVFLMNRRYTIMYIYISIYEQDIYIFIIRKIWSTNFFFCDREDLM